MNIDLHLDEPTHRMFAAPTRAGKSYFVGACIENLYADEHPFVILDTKTKNHLGLQQLPKVKRLKIRAGIPYDWNALAEYDYILCVPGTIETRTADVITVYRELVDNLWMKEGERFFIAEEAHNWNKNASVPDPLFETIAREGAGQRKYMWWITQRLQNFNQLLWAQCGFTYLFRFNIPSDIRYAEALIPDFSKINQELQKHDVLAYDHGTGEYEIIRAADVTRKTPHLG